MLDRQAASVERVGQIDILFGAVLVEQVLRRETACPAVGVMNYDDVLPTGTDGFDDFYFYGPTATEVPWDVHQAQPRLMELEALGGITGEVFDIGCGLGDNAIYLASRGHTVTGLDGSPAAIGQGRLRAEKAGASVAFAVADAINLTNYDGRFDTILDSALYHCLDDAGRHAYAAGMRRCARPGARWHLGCFSEDNVNGVIMAGPTGTVSESNIRDTLTASGWQIDFLGPTTYLANAKAFTAQAAPDEDSPWSDITNFLPSNGSGFRRRTSEWPPSPPSSTTTKSTYP